MSAAPDTYFRDDRAASVSRRSGDADMNFGERAVAAAGAAFISAILVNPLDVAKTRLQAQAAGIPYHSYERHVHRHIVSLGSNAIFSDIRCSPSCSRGGIFGTEIVCPPDCFQYKGTMDVFNKVIRQEGFARLWRGTNAALALAIPTAEHHMDRSHPGMHVLLSYAPRWNEQAPNARQNSKDISAALAHLDASRGGSCGGQGNVLCGPEEDARRNQEDGRRLARTPGCAGEPGAQEEDAREDAGGPDAQEDAGGKRERRMPEAGVRRRRRMPGLTEIGVRRRRRRTKEPVRDCFKKKTVARSLACIACSPIELARTRMQAFRESNSGGGPPGMWKTLVGVRSPLRSTSNVQSIQNYRILWTGVGAQLARDVPFSAICWSTLEPMRRRLLGLVGEEANAVSVLGANFAAGFVAGSLAAAATCPLDVVKTRRQIEKDPRRALKMTTRQTLIEVWRGGGMRGLFTGVGPRVARAGPSVGIVVSFYEVVKHVLHQRHSSL